MDGKAGKNDTVRVLGIVCSPRKGGNTEILVEAALASAKEAGAEVEMVTLSGKTISPCDACGACSRTGKCHIQDDMQDIYPKLLRADGIIVGSPVYFWTITAQAKAFIDRTSPLATAHRLLVGGSRPSPASGERQNSLRDKVGGGIVVSTRCGGTLAMEEIRAFMRIQRMVEGGGAIAYGDKPGEVRKDAQGMKEARYAGRAIVRMIRRLKGSQTT